MALIKCPECKKRISDQCDSCPQCGFPIKDAMRGVGATEKKTQKRIWIWLVVGVVLLGAALLLAYDKVDTADNMNKYETVPKVDADGTPVFVELTNEVYTNAENYKGYYVNVKGKVFQIIGDDGDVKRIQVWLDPETCNQNIMICYNSNVEVKQGDFVACSGYIDSVVEYKNAYDAIMCAPLVQSTDLKKSTYIEVVAPTLETITPEGLKQEKYGYSVSIEKVEFSEKELRIYATASNKGNGIFYVGASNAIVVQDGKQYNATSNYDANYEQIPYEIVSGAACSGIIVFPAISTNNFELTINVQSSDYTEKLENHVFVIGKTDSFAVDVERKSAIRDGERYKKEHKDVVLSTYDLHDYLMSLDYSERLCDELCYGDNVFNVYNGAAVQYEYERVEILQKLGNSREAIVDFYNNISWPCGDAFLGLSYERAASFVDACLAGKKLNIEIIYGYPEFVEY